MSKNMPNNLRARSIHSFPWPKKQNNKKQTKTTPGLTQSLAISFVKPKAFSLGNLTLLGESQEKQFSWKDMAVFSCLLSPACSWNPSSTSTWQVKSKRNTQWMAMPKPSPGCAGSPRVGKLGGRPRARDKPPRWTQLSRRLQLWKYSGKHTAPQGWRLPLD